MKAGRPLRFLALTLGGWAAVRAVMLWPEAAVELAATPASSPSPSVATARRVPLLQPTPLPLAPPTESRAAVTAEDPREEQANWAGGSAGLVASMPRDSARSIGSADTAVQSIPDERFSAILEATPDQMIGPIPAPPVVRRTRLRGDTWLVARSGGGENLAFGQLGASQAGMRLTYAIDRARSVALSARLSAPLKGRGREAALGLDWRPTRLPIHLLVEQRLPLDGGPARSAAQLIGGVAARLPANLRLEMYAQAGAVHRRGGFADGAARVTRPLLVAKAVTIEFGAGGWGAAQRDVERLDLGPTLGVTLPAQGGTVRLGIDYRVRVAGRARPGSGPALTLGTSF